MFNEIKLRNPSEETCQNIQDIMSKYNENAASKALTRYINQYPRYQSEAAGLRSERDLLSERLDIANRHLDRVKNQLQEIKDTWTSLQNLLK